MAGLTGKTVVEVETKEAGKRGAKKTAEVLSDFILSEDTAMDSPRTYKGAEGAASAMTRYQQEARKAGVEGLTYGPVFSGLNEDGDQRFGFEIHKLATETATE